MKKLFTLLLVAACAVSLHAQKKIKSTYTVTYEAGDTLGTTKGKRMPYVNADYIVFGHDGTTRQSKAFDGDSTELLRSEFVYLGGKLVKSESFFNGVKGSTTDFTYNEKGLLEKETYEYPEFNIKTTTTYTYDVQDRLVKKEVSNATGPTERREYKYENGVKTEEDMYSFNAGKPYIMSKLLFDKAGKITRSEYYDLNGKLMRSYDRKYDEHGNKIEEKEMSASTETVMYTTWKYTYDKQGNWTRSVQFAGRRATSVIERTIVYY